MKSKIGKFCTAAVVLVAVGAGMLILRNSTNVGRPGYAPEAGDGGEGQTQRVTKGGISQGGQASPGLKAESERIEWLYHSGDIGGLVAMLSEGQYASRVLAASYLARIGNSNAIAALERLSRETENPDNPFGKAAAAIRSRLERERGATLHEPNFSSATETESKTSRVDTRKVVSEYLSLKLATDKDTYYLHEPVVVTVTLTNISKSDVEIFYPELLREEIMRLGLNGRRSSAQLSQVEAYLPEKQKIMIEAGESVCATDVIEISRVGNYELEGEFRGVTNRGQWRGRLKAASISFKVVKSPSKERELELFKTKVIELLQKARAEFEADPNWDGASDTLQGNVAGMGPDTAPYIIQFYRQYPEPIFRRLLARPLVRVASPKALPFFQEMLVRGTDADRRMAAEGLYELFWAKRAGDEALEVLLGGTERDEVEIRRAVAEQLAKILTPAVKELFEQAISDEDENVRAVAARYLAAAEGLNLDKWLKLAGDEPTNARYVAGKDIVLDLEKKWEMSGGDLPEGDWEQVSQDVERLEQFRAVVSAWQAWAKENPHFSSRYFDADRKQWPKEWVERVTKHEEWPEWMCVVVGNRLRGNRHFESGWWNWPREWMSNWQELEARAAMGFAVAELPVEQRTVEGRKGILNERVQEAVAMLASDTSTPRGSLTDLGVDHMLITFTDLRVYELIKHAMSSEQARKEVIDEILPVIREYSSRADPNTILGQESFVKGWRSGYDSLLAILAAIDYTDAFPLVLKCFELHQAEIDNPVPQVYQEHGDWMPHGYGHNNYFSIYIDVALKHCAGDESIPPAARAIAAEHVSERKKVRTSTYKCAGHEISFPNPTNHHADPLRCALQFKRAMRDAGLWEDLTSSPD